jgi:hypothetical protein
MHNEFKKTYWKKIFILNFLFLKILFYNRLKIHKIFLDNIKFKKNKKLLDVGTTPILDKYNNIILHKFSKRNNITSLSNLDCSNLKKYFTKIRFVKGDAKKMIFKNNSFDIVYSSATIEHVGNTFNQIRFVEECVRVSADDIFITTPNRFYPIDFHTKLPLIHFFPKKIHRCILSFLGISFFAKEKNLNLLSVSDLKMICKILKIKNYRILKNSFLFFNSNLILHIKKYI